MSMSGCARKGIAIAGVLVVAACGNQQPSQTQINDAVAQQNRQFRGGPAAQPSGSLLDLFGKKTDPNTTVRVNKYIWNAALQVLDFLPVQSVDPFTGVIVTGYGRPPGGGRAYRATIYVQDPALDARSLNIAMESQGGAPVPVATVRAVEDAILTRARELRIQDSKL
ncbi:MAG: DUF3576 domain-containing protein [Paracoccaceae bacterium]|nr:DUF3576 domain-containing protein [Paracoccaceae bacterium]MDE3121998.1 DUF3576 domain-containing protein [Paracoccaceae bacterium]